MTKWTNQIVKNTFFGRKEGRMMGVKSTYSSTVEKLIDRSTTVFMRFTL